MFSFSTHPMNKSFPLEKHINFYDLLSLIKNSPIKERYSLLYKLRKSGNTEECRKYKHENIHWITPNAMVKSRKLSEQHDFDLNFIQSSGYVYFDIDEVEGSIDHYKNYLIEKYGTVVSLISKSSSNRGISILVKINVLVNSLNEFERVYEYVQLTYFSELKFDDDVKRLGATWFLPYDDDVFVNHDSCIVIPDEVLKGSCDVLYNTPPIKIHRVNPPNQLSKKQIKHKYIDLSIRDVFEQMNLETPVHFDGDFCISPTPILTIRFPRVIRDGSKRKVYRKVIHDIMTLNPDFTISHVYLFINHINENYANPKMDLVLLKKVVENQFEFITGQPNYQNKSKKTLRSIHYKNRKVISTNKKRGISNRFEGLMKRFRTYKRVQYAINYLLDEHYTYTNKQISELLGVSISTVKRNIKLKREDFERDYVEFTKEIMEVLKVDVNEFINQNQS